MKKQDQPPAPRPMRSMKHTGGFALLITITLLSFLVLLLVSLSALTRVETQVAANTQQVSQARQNALMALNVALGQLQRHAGLDRRVTTEAGILNSSNSGISLATDASPSQVDSFWASRSRHWSGVWRNPDAPTDIYKRTPTGELQSWLISGNESDQPGATPTFSPNDAVDNLATATATSGDLMITTKPAVLLVGSGSTDAAARYVAAPRKDINAGVPGLSGIPVIGRYAWWVGDEGVKAKFTVRDPYDGSADPVEMRYRRQVAQRLGIERVPGFDQYPVNSDALKKVSAFSQVALVDASLTPMVIKRHYHDIGVSSYGVLADTQAGGLRKDLTFHLEKTPAQGGLIGRILPATDAVFAEATQLSLEGPKWELLRSFYTFPDRLAGDGSLSLADATANVHGMYPVLVQARLFFRLEIRADLSCHLHLYPAFVLGNPYNVPLKGRAGFEYESNNNEWSLALRTQVTPGNALATGFERFDRRLVYDPASLPPLRMVIFRTPDFTILPGETAVFAAGASTPVSMPAGGGEVMLEEGFDPGRFTSLALGVTLVPADLSAPGGTGPKRLAFMAKKENSSLSLRYYKYNADVKGNTLQLIDNLGLSRDTSSEPPSETTAPEAAELPWISDMRGYRHGIRMPADGRIRTYADYNIRGRGVRRPLAQGAAGSLNDNPIFSGGALTNFALFTEDLVEPLWGRSALTSAGGVAKMVLFDIPRRPVPSAPSMLSLGQFQHASLTTDKGVYSTTNQPGSAFGNSLANPYVHRTVASESRTLSSGTEPYYDMSYLMNTALWDSCFFSTVPQASAATLPAQLPNARLVVRGPATITDLQSGSKASSRLLVDGAFNVNAVSVTAWAAFLSSARDATASKTDFRRSLNQLGSDVMAGDGISEDAYSGFRRLTDDQIYKPGATPDADTGLAVEIVKEVRRRGPFVSLAHFVNRKLTAGPATGTAAETPATLLGVKGALQAAIDNAGINGGFPTAENHQAAATTELVAYADPQAGSGALATGIPGWVTQADVLQSVGPVIAARSDTFVIRTYGETVNPVTGVTDGRAWCEAIAQRLPEYVKPKSGSGGDDPEIQPATDADNQTFGRRFQIVSFRWLSAGDI